MSTIITADHTAEDVFLYRLREDTSALHQKLERAPVSANLMNPSISEQQYSQYLAAMRGVIAWTESHVFPAIAPIIDDIESRRKLLAIDTDLKNLQFTQNFSGDFSPSLSSNAPSSMLGFMYVTEGSSLGGMVILKQLQQCDFIRPETTNFLTVYGKETASQWKKFVTELSVYTVKNRIESDVIQGAREAFKSIDDYFLSIN